MGELYRLDFENGKSYIGITTKTSKERLKGHAKASKKRNNVALYNAWNKYGIPKLSVIAIVENKFLAETEIKAISIFKTIVPFGYNSTPGGDISPMTVPEIAAKMKKPKTESHKMNLSLSRIGKKASVEAKLKMSLARKGRKATEKEIERITNFNPMKNPEIAFKNGNKRKGQKRSEETKNNMRKPRSEIGKINMRKPKSEQGKENIRIAQKKRRERELKAKGV